VVAETRAPAYVQTPTTSPHFSIKNLLLALDCERGVPILGAQRSSRLLGASNIKEAEPWCSVGRDRLLYPILAHRSGDGGRVYAYKIDEGLAAGARENLRDAPQLTATAIGITVDLPLGGLDLCLRWCPPAKRTWLDACDPKGASCFPLARRDPGRYVDHRARPKAPRGRRRCWGGARI